MSQLDDFSAAVEGLYRSALDPAAWAQMQRLADACNDQAEAVGKIYDVAGVSRPQRVALRERR